MVGKDLATSSSINRHTTGQVDTLPTLGLRSKAVANTGPSLPLTPPEPHPSLTLLKPHLSAAKKRGSMSDLEFILYDRVGAHNYRAGDLSPLAISLLTDQV